MSAQEAKELFASVDEIMEFASKSSGLPIKNKVKKKLASRESVEKYLSQRMDDDEDQKRFDRSALVLKKFGLIPRDFQLRPFMIKLLKEQVAGFYDPKKNTVNLLDWIAPSEQRPVMAHELTHALQDQAIGLDAWSKTIKAAIHKKMDDENADAEIDEELSAQTAVLEGQGMAVMADYLLAPSGQSIKNSPQIVDAMRYGMSADESSPMLKSAPLILKEALIFPYRDGLGFVGALLQDGGVHRAFAQALADPPKSTREVLTPKAYLEKEVLPPMRLPNLKPMLGKDYERYDTGSIGQFDVMVLLKQFTHDRTPETIPPEWRGGVYYSAVRKGKKAGELKTADLELVFISRWSSVAAAKKFAFIYASSVGKRYTSVQPGMESTFETEEGPVSVEVVGDAVIVFEGLNEAAATTAHKLVMESLNGVPNGIEVHAGDLGMRVMAPVYAVWLRQCFAHTSTHDPKD